jgi:hypothetical protein
MYDEMAVPRQSWRGGFGVYFNGMNSRVSPAEAGPYVRSDYVRCGNYCASLYAI